MTACSAIMECRHKIAFVSTLPIEKLLPWFPVCAFYFLFCSHLCFDLFCYHFYFRFFYSWLSAGCCHQQMIATFTHEGHLIPRQERKNLQAVNELPSMPSVKGVYKLTEAFVRALFAPSLFLAIATTFSPPPPISHSLLLFNFLPLPACFTLQ